MFLFTQGISFHGPESVLRSDEMFVFDDLLILLLMVMCIVILDTVINRCWRRDGPDSINCWEYEIAL